ncbi:hypothetical protein ABIC83_003068 [Roseateles asaccharophilus]|uniref:hypothetical protein n=1 Tax=Roseateles asaccharophilus TaxID=582607 RepID=UPI0038344B12
MSDQHLLDASIRRINTVKFADDTDLVAMGRFDPNAVAPMAADELQGLGTAYMTLRARIETLIQQLGGHKFARSAVTLSAENALREQRRGDWSKYDKHLLRCEALVYSADEINASVMRLNRYFSIVDEPVLFSAEAFGGRIVLKGRGLYFETAQAAMLMGHYFKESGSVEKWMITLTKVAEAFIDHTGRDRCRISTTHAKSEASALKAILRMAEEGLGFKLAPVPAANLA